MRKLVLAALAATVLAVPASADGGRLVDDGPLLLKVADAYEEDYSDEFDRATKDTYKAKDGKSERLAEKEWEWWEPILDRDPFWAGPINHENGSNFHHLLSINAMEAAATLDPWHFYIKVKAEAYRETFDDTDRGEDVRFNSQVNLVIGEARIGLPFRFEIGLKYIFGENTERGKNDTFWFDGRDQLIRDDERDDGSKAAEIWLKWNVWKHKDGVSGFGFLIRYKEPLAIRSNFMDMMVREAGVNLIGSIKWGPASFHLNAGWVYVRDSRLLFASRVSTGSSHPDEIDSFFTGGFAISLQIWEFIALVAQAEGHTNAFDDELDDTFESNLMGSGMAGLRFRVGPVVGEAGIGRGFTVQDSELFGIASVGIKF